MTLPVDRARLVRRLVLRAAAGIGAIAAMLFGVAGRLDNIEPPPVN